MVVETSEYLLNRADFLRAAIRTYYKRLWSVALVCLIEIVVCSLEGWYWVALAFAVTGAGLPYLIAIIRVNRAMNSPLNQKPVVTRFTDDAMEQLVDGDRRALLRYDELKSFDRIPEGLRIWAFSKIWFLVPKAAFSTPEDFEGVCECLIRAGKLKQPK